MSLKSLTNYWSSKSIKLSDAFEVLIQYSPTSQFETMVNCTGFTLPKLEYDEETYEYGNVAQVFVVPKYDSCKEVTLESNLKDLGIDSLDLVEIVLAAEDEFGITFSDEELNSFKTVKDVCTVLDSKK